MTMEEKRYFYLDRILRIRFNYTLVLFTLLVVFLDFITSVYLHLEFIPADPPALLAYLVRLSFTPFFFSVMRLFYYKASDLLNHFAEQNWMDNSLREKFLLLKVQLSFLNKPVHHLLAAALANAVYLVILYSYVFPILKWSPFHVISNAVWAGMLGIAFYLAACGVRFTMKLLSLMHSPGVINPLHKDGMGGLSPVSKLLIDVFVLSGFVTGLWIGSIPYAFKYEFLFLILCLGLSIEIIVLGYAFYQLHATLKSYKSAEIEKYLSFFEEVQKALERTLTLDEKVDMLLRLSLAEIALTNIYKMHVWPIKYKDLIEVSSILMSFLPIVLQYLFTLYI
jgi:hypothetical protein